MRCCSLPTTLQKTSGLGRAMKQEGAGQKGRGEIWKVLRLPIGSSALLATRINKKNAPEALV